MRYWERRRREISRDQKLKPKTLSLSLSLFSRTLIFFFKMKKSRTVSSNIPRLSLSLFSRTLIFFFKNIQSLQSKLQVCSLIQSFPNSRFMYLFLALYIIEFLKFLNFLEKSDLNRSLCVCVWRTVQIRRSSYCYLGFGWVISASSPSQWRSNQKSAGPWVEP